MTRALTISVEAQSEEHLKKLLELALFELDKVGEDSRSMLGGSTIPLNMEGTMGHYSLQYKLGSHELIQAQEKLIEHGYVRVEGANWIYQEYSVFTHPSEQAVRLYFSSAEVIEHDEEEHQANLLKF